MLGGRMCLRDSIKEGQETYSSIVFAMIKWETSKMDQRVS